MGSKWLRGGFQDGSCSVSPPSGFQGFPGVVGKGCPMVWMGYGEDLVVKAPSGAGAQGTVPGTASAGTLALPAGDEAKGGEMGLILGFGGHPTTLIPPHDFTHALYLVPKAPLCGFVVPVCGEGGSVSHTWGPSSGSSSQLNVFHKDLGS